ncbi:MAG: Rid family detoxifying hydrolase [Clostridia bacterium]|nr:Rid family detoxifying hydrolase [Clostridia bacterium]
MKEAVVSGGAPKAIGPYSQGIQATGLIFVSGQIPLDPGTGTMVPGGIAEQTVRVLESIAGVLAAAGAGMESVAKTTVFLTDMDNFAAMNRVYASYFPGVAPARSTIEVSRLPKDALVEIEAIAIAHR